MCIKNLRYFQFIDNETVTLLKMNGILADVFFECMKGLTVCQNFLGLPLAFEAVVRKWLDTALRLNEDVRFRWVLYLSQSSRRLDSL